MTSSAGGTNNFSDHRFRAPSVYTAQLLTLQQHRANNQFVLLGGAAPNLCWGSKGGTSARSWLGIVRATGPDPFRHCSRPNTHLHYMPHLRGHSCRLRCIYPLLTSCFPIPRDAVTNGNGDTTTVSRCTNFDTF